MGYHKRNKKEDAMKRHITGNIFAPFRATARVAPTWFVLGMIGTLLMGCDTRRSILDDQGVWVRVEVDWAQAGIRPAGTSLYVYNHATGARATQLLTNAMRDSVTIDSLRLRAGHYSLLAFNETERSHDYISFRGTDSYHTAEAYANPLALPEGSRYARGAAAHRSASEHTALAASDVLAAAHLDHFEVDYDMIRNQSRPPLRTTPQKLTATVEVTIHVQNIYSLHATQQQAGALGNMAEGVFLATGATNANPVTHWFALTPSSSDPARITGTLHASFAVFGTLGSGGNILSLYLLLRDGQEYTIERDVTGLLLPGNDTPGGQLSLTIEIGTGRDNDPRIDLPDTPTDGNGMFQVGVGDWDDNNILDIPI
jgi:hypothetical protein